MNTELTLSPVTKSAETLDGTYWYAGNLLKVLVDGSQTDGRYAQLEMTLQAGSEPAPHTHTREDETFYLLEGSIRFTIGNHEFTAKAGDYVLMPKNIPHSFKLMTPTAKTVMTVAPAGFENYFLNPLLATPATSLTLPDAPQGPPSAELLEAIVKLLKEEYGIII